MPQHDDTKQFTASDNATAIFRLNPGLNFSAADLRAIQAGTLVPVGPGTIVTPPGTGPVKNFGCIEELRYGDSDKDLVRVKFDSGDVLAAPGTFPGNCNNLNDFRERLQEAADFGFGVTGCLNTTTRKLSMLNLIACRCKCDRKD